MDTEKLFEKEDNQNRKLFKQYLPIIISINQLKDSKEHQKI